MQSVVSAYAITSMVLTVGLVALLHVLEPEFAPSWRMPSEYALGRYGVLMRMAFVVGGTGVMAAGVALAAVAAPASFGLCLVAIGPVGAAFFATDPITTPRTSFSRTGNLHSAFGSVFILGFPVVATIVGISAAGTPSIGPVLAVASLAPWAGLIWFMARTIRSSSS